MAKKKTGVVSKPRVTISLLCDKIEELTHEVEALRAGQAARAEAIQTKVCELQPMELVSPSVEERLSDILNSNVWKDMEAERQEAVRRVWEAWQDTDQDIQETLTSVRNIEDILCGEPPFYWMIVGRTVATLAAVLAAPLFLVGLVVYRVRQRIKRVRMNFGKD